jgi:hypothetical protein
MSPTSPTRTYAPGTQPPQRSGSGGSALSEKDTERLRLDQPDQPVKLQAGWIACRSCGIAVSRTSDAGAEIVLESLGRLAEGPAALTQASQNQPPVTLTFALCPSRRRTAELAEQLVADPIMRPLRARLGHVALHQVNCALDALSFLAPNPASDRNPTVEHLTSSLGADPEGLSAMVHHLAHPGALARWTARFVPFMAADASPQTCSPYPFAHLMRGARQQLRGAYASLLRERVARNARRSKSHRLQSPTQSAGPVPCS